MRTNECDKKALYIGGGRGRGLGVLEHPQLGGDMA